MNQSKSHVLLLGSGNPNPDPAHAGPAVAILVEDQSYLIDCGVGVVRQAAAMTPEYGGVYQALEAHNLKRVFLTHLHSDHTIGLPDLILTPWVMGRDEPLEVYGPAGTKKLIRHLLQAYQEDIDYRLNGLQPTNYRGWRVNVKEISQGLIYKDAFIEAEAFRVKHGSWSNAYGYRFKTTDKVIVLSGDTAPCENILEFSREADILIHEVYSQRGFDQREAIWQQYHTSHHTSTLELAKLAKEAKPELLVTYHTLYWGTQPENIRAEIVSIYTGDVVVGKDFQVFT
jgi:ribonuclease Z